MRVIREKRSLKVWNEMSKNYYKWRTKNIPLCETNFVKV